jgi:NADPH-dependent 2,4-dienoyl-CoA reductase/sulfur reductase-like enzyme
LKVGTFSVLIRGTKSDALIYAVGRQANGDQLNLEAAGVTVGSRGRLKVNEYFQTEVPHIYAAGDVIGFPALANRPRIGGADELYREIRIENSLTNENGDEVRLKKGAEVEITVEADPEATTPASKGKP